MTKWKGVDSGTMNTADGKQIHEKHPLFPSILNRLMKKERVFHLQISLISYNHDTMTNELFLAAIGGMMIGLASWLMLALNGQIAGISGILGGLLTSTRKDKLWQATFIVGLPLGAAVVSLFGSGLAIVHQASGVQLAVAGLLVGIGPHMGSGCTSGHGICGLSRRSPRSLVATLTFMAVAILTVTVLRRVL